MLRPLVRTSLICSLIVLDDNPNILLMLTNKISNHKSSASVYVVFPVIPRNSLNLKRCVTVVWRLLSGFPALYILHYTITRLQCTFSLVVDRDLLKYTHTDGVKSTSDHVSRLVFLFSCL